MLDHPTMRQLTEKINNRYLLVNVAAKRAREIAQEAEDSGEPLTEKPVTLALEDIVNDRIHLREESVREVNDDIDPNADAEQAGI